MKRRQLPGFNYDAKRKRLVLDGRVAVTKQRRQKTIDNVTRDQALVAWKAFREDLASGRAIEGPLTLRQFVEGYYERIAAGHAPSTRKTEGIIIKNHLLRYFGDTLLSDITSIRVVDFKADMRKRACSPSYINNAARVLKLLLRQAVERDVIADYPIRKKVPKDQEVPLRLEMKVDERTRFFAAFDDEQAFRRRLDARRRLGPVRSSDHFESDRRFGASIRADGEAAAAYWRRFRDLRDFFLVAVESGLRVGDLRELKWSSIDLAAGFSRVVMRKTRREAVIPISSACHDALRASQARAVVSVYVFVDERGRPFSLARIGASSRSRRSSLASRGVYGYTICDIPSAAASLTRASAFRRSRWHSATHRHEWPNGTHSRRRIRCPAEDSHRTCSSKQLRVHRNGHMPSTMTPD